MKSRRLALSVLSVPLAATILAGCAQGSASSQEENAESAATGISVVATTNVYRDIAQSIGGEHVQATEIITSPAQDPHSYEPSARDKLTISKAQVVLANGGGYDDFVTQLVASLPADSQAHTIYAVDSSPVLAEYDAAEAEEEHAGEEDHADEAEHADHADEADHAGETAHADEAEHADHADETEHADEHGNEESNHDEAADPHAGHDHAGFNEHIWFDLESMSELAGVLADEFSEIAPEHSAEFAANAETFQGEMDRLGGELKAAGVAGQSFAMTEPVPFHLLVDAGMTDATPEGLSAAVESGSDIPPQILKELNDALEAGSIDLLAYNIQTEGSDSVSIRTTAEANSVPVVEFAETMNSDQHFAEWIGAQIQELAEVVGK